MVGRGDLGALGNDRFAGRAPELGRIAQKLDRQSGDIDPADRVIALPGAMRIGIGQSLDEMPLGRIGMAIDDADGFRHGRISSPIL